MASNSNISNHIKERCLFIKDYINKEDEEVEYCLIEKYGLIY